METKSHFSDSLPKYLSEDELTQESKNLISSLPEEKGWVTESLYQYQGFWHAARYLQGALNIQQQFQAEDSDVLLVTSPKSGTTWLKSLVFALVNRGKFKTTEEHPLLTSSPHSVVRFLELDVYIETRTPDLLKMPSPRLLATLLPFVSLPEPVKDNSCKIVYLCRDPKDVFVSLWHFANSLRPKKAGSFLIEEAFEEFCRGVSLFGPIWDHVLDYWKKSLENPKKILFLKYEEMMEQPKIQVKRLADFLGYKVSVDEERSGVVDDILKLCSFDNLRNMEVNKRGKLSTGQETKVFFRKGNVGDWKNHLTLEMAEIIDRITEEKLRGSGLKF